MCNGILTVISHVLTAGRHVTHVTAFAKKTAMFELHGYIFVQSSGKYFRAPG